MKHASKVAAIIALTLGIVVLSFKLGKTLQTPTNAQAQNHIVLLRFGESICTGVKVMSPKNKAYIITAGHCFSQEETEVSVILSDRVVTVRRLLLSKDRDLGVLTTTDGTGLRLAWDVVLPSDAHTMAYTVLPSTSFIGPYYKNGQVVTYAQNGNLCNPYYLSQFPSACNVFLVGTMAITPGNSGGALLDTDNSLIGIISNYDAKGFSYHVRLEDIRSILKEADEIQ